MSVKLEAWRDVDSLAAASIVLRGDRRTPLAALAKEVVAAGLKLAQFVIDPAVCILRDLVTEGANPLVLHLDIGYTKLIAIASIDFQH